MSLTQHQRYYLEKATERDLSRDDLGNQGGLNTARSLVKYGWLDYLAEKEVWRITEAGMVALGQRKVNQPMPALDLDHVRQVCEQHGFRVALDAQGALRVVGYPPDWDHSLPSRR